VAALNQEWAGLSTSALAQGCVSSWRQRFPELSAYTSLDDLVSACEDPARSDAVLRCLVSLTKEGDRLAGRAAVQALLANVVRLAWRTRAHANFDQEESRVRAVEALWQALVTYPLDSRRCRVVHGVTLDALNLLTHQQDRSEETESLWRELPEDIPAPPADEPSQARASFWSAAGLGEVRACSDEQLILVLAWAVKHDVITTDDARLLLHLYNPNEAGAALNHRQAAAALGLGYDVARQRASRLVRKIRAAVSEASAESEEIHLARPA
jgi:hypothetical protein